MRELTLLSLFDGSGGFPLAASMCGIRPVACAEVEPYPITVTRSRFPNMKHLGSVTDVHGGDIEPVDIITFGSPCQDLSVAGKRAGLKHEANGDDETTRSGLFMEAVRIIKEMRKATNGEYPTFAVWENVPGAFSSNKGEDFRTVLEELIKIVEPTAVMPAVPKNGWSYSDSYCGDGWSLAYRVFDAQYWGVPQRRRRIYLVLDLRGQRAGKVSFEREGLRGNFETFKTAGQGTAGDATNRAGADNCEGECVTHTFQNTGQGWWNESGVGTTLRTPCGGDSTLANVVVQTVDGNILDDQGGQQITVRTDGKAPTLRAETHGNLPAVMEPVTIEPGIAAREGGHIYEGVCGTLRANAGDNQMAVAYAAGFNYLQGSKARTIGFEMEKAGTLRAGQFGDAVLVKCYDARGNGDGQMVSTLTGDHENRITDYTSVVVEKSPVYCLQGNGIDRADTAGCNGKGWKEDTSYTLNTIDRPAVVYQQQAYDKFIEGEIGTTLKACGGDYGGGSETLVCERKHIHYIVRRLTPTECARLQGFPDDWGHPDHKDDFTDEEYRFWLNVRNTHAAINGKPQKDYTKAQMLTWYNKLHTDSSEYKMWGNGISLPTALYVMQGIAEALKGGEG